jgi:hypothetical protein
LATNSREREGKPGEIVGRAVVRVEVCVGIGVLLAVGVPWGVDEALSVGEETDVFAGAVGVTEGIESAVSVGEAVSEGIIVPVEEGAAVGVSVSVPVGAAIAVGRANRGARRGVAELLPSEPLRSNVAAGRLEAESAASFGEADRARAVVGTAALNSITTIKKMRAIVAYCVHGLRAIIVPPHRRRQPGTCP